MTTPDPHPLPESPAELAAEAKRLLTIATNASFDCGQWDDDADEDDGRPSYETLAAAANKARQDLHAAIDRLAALHADQARDARAQALEEAAKACDAIAVLWPDEGGTPSDCAAAVRALASATPVDAVGKEKQ